MMAGKYQVYPEYKESGVEWLGSIPNHWETKRVGHYFDERREKVSDKVFSPLSVTMQGIVPQLETAAKTDAGDNRKLVLKNDFVINSRSDRKGSSGVSNYNGSVSLISIVLEPRSIHPGFVHHLFRSYPFQEEFYRHGKGIVADLWSTNSSELKNILIPIVPKNEQAQIANFLDHETTKIDTLIEKQQQLIKLLKEKRQAVISHAVTKGLNPDAPMRDSGVEWLGEVPEHWKVSHLKRKLISTDYGISESTKEEGAFEVLTMGDIQDGKIIPPHTRYVETIDDKLLLEKGDLLFNRTNSLNLVGKVGLFLGGDNISFASYCVRLRVDKDCDPRYFNYLLNSGYMLSSARASSFPSISQTNLNPNRYGFLYVAYPELNEQIQIADMLDKKSADLLNIVDKSEKQIGLFQERRTALISAAVTGKIDVRNWKPPKQKQASKEEAV